MTTPKTTTAANPSCFVILPSPDPRLQSLYQEIFRVAIEEAQLAPVLPPVAPGSLPSLETVAAQIRDASACFADLTHESPYTWFALGCAAALGKPLCLVASSGSSATSFAAAYPATIHYPILPLPSDYQRLQQEITDRLLLVPGRNETVEAVATAEAVLKPKVEPEVIALEEKADAILESAPESTYDPQPSAAVEAAFEPIQLTVADVRVHELLALSIIARGQPPYGTTLRLLALEMHKHGAAQATSLSLNGLCRKRLVERKLTDIEDDAGSRAEDCLFVTAAGRAWIEATNLNLSFEPPPLDANPDNLMDLIHAL